MKLLSSIAFTALQAGAESPKKGDKTDRSKSPGKAAKSDGAKPDQKKAAGDGAASPKTESKLKKRGEIDMEGKFISK